MKTFGALLGTPIAIGIMYLTSDNFRTVFLCATVPVILSIICLVSVKTSNMEERSIQKRESIQAKISKIVGQIILEIVSPIFDF